MSYVNKVHSFETKTVGSDAVSFLIQNIAPICDPNWRLPFINSYKYKEGNIMKLETVNSNEYIKYN